MPRIPEFVHDSKIDVPVSKSEIRMNIVSCFIQTVTKSVSESNVIAFTAVVNKGFPRDGRK